MEKKCWRELALVMACAMLPCRDDQKRLGVSTISSVPVVLNEMLARDDQQSTLQVALVVVMA